MSSPGFRFVMFEKDAPGLLARLGLGGDHVLSLDDGLMMGLHLLPFTDGDAAHLDARAHRRHDGKALDCVSLISKSLGTTALVGQADQQSYVMLDAGYIARVACICDLLDPAITAQVTQADAKTLTEDPELMRLLRRFRAPSWREAEEVAQGFPMIATRDNPFGGYMVFQDLVRLIWLHEWAHVMLGHSELWADQAGQFRFAEHDAARKSMLQNEIDGVPWALALQSFELQADQFAATFITQQILWGFDPAGALAGPSVDLVQRLCMFAAACAVFAVDSALVEGSRANPLECSHPSAALRYMTLLNVIQEVAASYDDPRLAGYVQVSSFGFIERLARLNRDFWDLLSVTPMLAKTPIYKDLCREQDLLMTTIGQRLSDLRLQYTYFPTKEA